MHSCLYITEILSIIFASLHRSHLPVVARICRAWEKPALDVLWKSMDDLLPLIDLFPQDSRTLSLPRVCTPRFRGIRLTINSILLVRSSQMTLNGSITMHLVCTYVNLYYSKACL